MKTFRCCLKNILADEFKVSGNTPVGNCYQVTLKDIEQNLVIQNMPLYVVVVKCPPGQNWLFKGSYTQVCDYLIFDPSCNAVILCELKKKFSKRCRREAVKQIQSTKKLVQYIIAGMETHCKIDEANRKIKEHYMMFSSEEKGKKRLEKGSTHDPIKKMHVFITSKISYSKIREAIGCKSVN